MTKLIMLGTGHAMVTKYYNTCFLIENNNQYLLVDTGGGNQILEQLEKVSVNINQIHDVFITHNHIDHMVGLFWILRCVVRQIRAGKYDGNLNIYITKKNAKLVKDYILAIYKEYIGEFFDRRIFFIDIYDGMKLKVGGNYFEILDLHSLRCSQFGFKMTYDDNKTLSFFGDLPYNIDYNEQVHSSNYIIHEAFCLDSQKEIFKPHEKSHSTVKDACETATKLNAKNIILVHTEDSNIQNRRELYIYEGKKYFEGNIYVPEDLEEINL